MTNNLLRKEKKGSLVRDTLLDFVKRTEFGGSYEIRLDATDILDPKKIVSADEATDRAQNFVHRMRAELSRLRNKVRERKRVPQQFKMLLTSVVIEGEQIVVTIVKSKGAIHEVQEDVEDAFASIAGGAIIDGK